LTNAHAHAIIKVQKEESKGAKIMKLFIYNFHGDIYETTTAFDATYRAKKAEAIANGESFSRQVVDGDKVTNEVYRNGIWLTEE
jgi:hypothetical protein